MQPLNQIVHQAQEQDGEWHQEPSVREQSAHSSPVRDQPTDWLQEHLTYDQPTIDLQVQSKLETKETLQLWNSNSAGEPGETAEAVQLDIQQQPELHETPEKVKSESQQQPQQQQLLAASLLRSLWQNDGDVAAGSILGFLPAGVEAATPPPVGEDKADWRTPSSRRNGDLGEYLPRSSGFSPLVRSLAVVNQEDHAEDARTQALEDLIRAQATERERLCIFRAPKFSGASTRE